MILPGRPTFRLDPKIAKELLHYGKFITASTILLFIATEIDTAVIGKMLDVEKLGHYTVAFTLANFPATHVAFVISNIMFSAYSKIQGEPELLRSTFCKVTDLVASLVLPVMTGMAMAADLLITVLFGDKWADAAGPFRILCLFGALHAIVTVNGYMFNAIGRPDIGFRIAILRLAGIAVIIGPAIFYGGVIGAAAAMAFIMLTSLIYGFVQVRRVIGVSTRAMLKALSPALTKSAAVAAGILLVSLFIQTRTVLDLVIVVGVSALIYVPMNLRLAKLVLKNK
jgi:lipopolysaccharide exporter